MVFIERLNLRFNIEKLNKLFVMFMLVTFQCYYILPGKIVFVLKILNPMIVILLSLKINKKRMINIDYLLWVFLFYIVCVLSVLLSNNTYKSFDILMNLSTTLLLLLSVSQYITNAKQLKNVINYLIIGGVFYGGYIVFKQGISDILVGNIDTKYTNGTITQFTYVTLPTSLYLIWKVAFEQRFKIINILLLIFSMLLNFASGRRKAVMLPILFLGVILFLKENKRYKKIVRISSFLLLVYLFFLVSMKSEYLYQMYGYRIDNFITMIFGIGEGRIDGSLVARKSLIGIGINAFINSPIIGRGIGTFGSLNQWGYYAHNNYVELLATMGLLGAITYYSVYIYLITNTYKLRKVISKDMLIFIIATIFIVLINDFGAVTYYRPHFTIFVTLAAVIINFSKKKVKI